MYVAKATRAKISNAFICATHRAEPAMVLTIELAILAPSLVGSSGVSHSCLPLFLQTSLGKGLRRRSTHQIGDYVNHTDTTQFQWSPRRKAKDRGLTQG